MLRILAPLLISGALGWVVLRLFFRPFGMGLRIAFYSTFGIPIGASLFGMTAFLVFLFDRPGPDAILIAFAIPAALAVAGGFLQSSGKLWNPVPLKVTFTDRSDILTILSIGLLLACIASGVLLAIYFYDFPHGMWDAHAMWNARARTMFRTPDHWRDVFLPEHPHPDYPLSLPLLVFTGWTVLGRETQVVPLAIAAVFLFVAAGIVGLGVAIWKSPAWGLVAAALMLCSIGYVALAGSQYADVPLSTLYVTSIILCSLAYRGGNVSQPVLSLAGVVAAFCGWMKNEGNSMIFGLAFGIALGCVALRAKPVWFRQVGCFLAGAAPIWAALQYQRSLAPSNDLMQAITTGGLQPKLLDTNRWMMIAKEYGSALLNAPGTIVPLAVLIIFVWLIAGIHVERDLRVPLIAGWCATAVICGSYFGAYLITPHSLTWHLNTSANRLALQLMPTFVFLALTLVRAEFLQPEIPRSVSAVPVSVPETPIHDVPVISPVAVKRRSKRGR